MTRRKLQKSEDFVSLGEGIKRSSYPMMFNLSTPEGVHVATFESRAYGEGGAVAVGNGIKTYLKRGDATVNKRKDGKGDVNSFGGELTMNNGYKLQVRVVWHPTQCQSCGATEDAKNDWCPYCMGTSVAPANAVMSGVTEDDVDF